MNLVRNAWYCAGWSHEFGEALTPCTILGERLVLWRCADGRLVALEDRCPHRLLPLSMGRRVGDAVQCGYHGMTFGPDGACRRVPGQSNLPASARVETWPVEERHGVVWVWMGERERADPAAIFEIPQMSAPGWHRHHGGHLELAANWMNVCENLVDPAHVSFVHPTTLGNAASENVPVSVDLRGDPLVAWRWIRNGPPVGFFKAFGGLSDMVDRWHYYYLHLPSVAVIDFGSADSALALPEERRHEGVQVFALHFVTPVDAHHSVDHWMHLRNTALDDPAASARIDSLLQTAFAEDKAVLEAIEKEEARPMRRKPVRIAIDAAPRIFRRRVAELIEAEASIDLGAAENPAFRYLE